jgi:hypothetical protein
MKSRAENMLCPTGSTKLLGPKSAAPIAKAQPVQRGKLPELEIAIPMKMPPTMNRRIATAAVRSNASDPYTLW